MTHIQGRRNKEGDYRKNLPEITALTAAVGLAVLSVVNWYAPPDITPPPQAIVRPAVETTPELVNLEHITDIDRLNQLAMDTVMLSSPEQLQAIAEAYKQVKQMNTGKLRSDAEVIISTYERMGWVFSNDTVFTVLPPTAGLPDWMNDQNKLPDGLDYRVLAAQAKGSFIGVGRLGCAIDNTPGKEKLLNPYESSLEKNPLDITPGCPFPVHIDPNSQLNTATN